MSIIPDRYVFQVYKIIITFENCEKCPPISSTWIQYVSSVWKFPIFDAFSDLKLNTIETFNFYCHGH